MTYLVTGGAGFIGANFVYYMLEKHPADRIVCVDKLTYAGNLSTLADALKHPNSVLSGQASATGRQFRKSLKRSIPR